MPDIIEARARGERRHVPADTEQSAADNAGVEMPAP